VCFKSNSRGTLPLIAILWHCDCLIVFLPWHCHSNLLPVSGVLEVFFYTLWHCYNICLHCYLPLLLIIIIMCYIHFCNNDIVAA